MKTDKQIVFLNKQGGETAMSNSNSSNNFVVPEAKAAMDKFKMEAANDVGVSLYS